MIYTTSSFVFEAMSSVTLHVLVVKQFVKVSASKVHASVDNDDMTEHNIWTLFKLDTFG